MKYGRLLMCVFWVFLEAGPVSAQRIYAAHSVLASNSWYKLSVSSPGIYKIDIPFLNALGVNTANLASASIRLFGNGGHMLAEANNGAWTDDLKEDPVFISDGGDGQFNGSDYLLFYAPGPDEWTKDSLGQSFNHRKNLYSDRSYYFLSIGGTGLRIPTAAPLTNPTVTVSSFSERSFHELDTVNFLSSGKEWYGEELSNLPGRSLTRTFPVNLPNIVSNTSIRVRTGCVARSVGTGSRFDISFNNQPVGQLLINPVAGGQYDLFAQEGTGNYTSSNAQANSTIGFSFTPGSFNAQGWINWFECFSRRVLSLAGTDQLSFRDWPSVGNARIEFIIASASGATQVWEVTDPQNPQRMAATLSGTDLHFTGDGSRLREYIAFNSSNFLVPANEGKVDNQDLHNSQATDMIIVTDPLFVSEAQQLAALHARQNLVSTVVTTTALYNEFASGSPDPTSIRDLAKMYYDRYRNSGRPLKYLLLFGDASYDYRNRLRGNTNMVPAYENNNSLDPLSSYTSDDFFGFLDDQDDIGSSAILNLLDIGIGRIPVSSKTEAKNFVDKLASYLSPGSFGPWRNTLTFIADDEDNNLHFQDAELISASAATVAPVFNENKIYLDAYRQETGPGGSIYPQANQAINSQLYNGTLIWNYNGHGGPARLAEETIVDQSIINGWNNEGKLPLFITATCDFAPYDNPLVHSIGENILVRPKTGAIALMTTTRPVFAFSNRIMNNNYVSIALQPDLNGEYKTLGDAMKDAKNYTYQNSSDISNNRKFTLLGDPALRLGFPSMRARITRVNGIPAATTDTLSATETVFFEGEVTDRQQNLLTGFNGTVYPVLFDKPQLLRTLGNDPGSQPADFQAQTTVLFRGKASVINGKFSFSFKVPKDINYQYGNGKMSLYATDSVTDANGMYGGMIIGGAAIDNSGDHKGPVIKAYLNDERFVNGGISNQQPVLIVKLSDSSGINTAGSGIDHDIVATLDNDNRKYFILNDYYQSDLNNFQQGSLRFQMPVLEAGQHSLKIKAWDVLDNSNETVLEFVVQKDEELQIAHVLNYPNPFHNSTRFWFEHNKPGQQLLVHVQVMTITGRVVKTLSRSIITVGNRSDEIEWDGRDDAGDLLGRGVYLYKLMVSVPGAGKKEILGKLVIL